MFPTFRVLRRRGDGLHPVFVRAVPADTCCRGGRCPLTIAAALGRDDFESGSASKSGWCELEPCSQLDANRVGQRLGYMSSTEINTIPLDNRPRRVLK